MYCSQQIFHIVQPRDTIYWLARNYNTTVQEIMAGNPGINPYNLQVGTRLVICPGGRQGHSVMPNNANEDRNNRGNNQGSTFSNIPGTAFDNNIYNDPAGTAYDNNTYNEPAYNNNTYSEPAYNNIYGNPSGINYNIPFGTISGNGYGGYGEMPQAGYRGFDEANPDNSYSNSYQPPRSDAYQDAPGNYRETPGSQMINNFGDNKKLNLYKKMRLVWSQHIYWTRLLLISLVEQLKDRSAVTDRILRNPRDIADIYNEYFSDEDADEIAALLKEHLKIGANLIIALRDNQTDKAGELNSEWYANADQIAEALSRINPGYDKEELRKMLYEHLELITKEVKARVAQEYTEDIDAFDQVEKSAMDMADYLTEGLIRSTYTQM